MALDEVVPPIACALAVLPQYRIVHRGPKMGYQTARHYVKFVALKKVGINRGTCSAR
jgi:hypothetical protein